jgi:hypothetical protein
MGNVAGNPHDYFSRQRLRDFRRDLLGQKLRAFEAEVDIVRPLQFGHDRRDVGIEVVHQHVVLLHHSRRRRVVALDHA